MDTDHDVPSAPSTPVTPSTPGAPLFHGFKAHGTSSGNGRRSFLRSCKCFNVEQWAMEEGSLPTLSCSWPTPPLPVSLARKVYLSEKDTLLKCTTFLSFYFLSHFMI